MSDASIRETLRASFEDHRLSRSEKRALAEQLRPLGGDPQRLALVRHAAFELVRDRMANGTAEGGAGEKCDHAGELTEWLDWLEAVVKVLWPREDLGTASGRSEALFSPHDGCAARIVRLFDSARKEVDVCVFTITDDRIRDAILDAHGRGVRVRVISDNDKAGDLGSDIEPLARRGVAVRVDRSEYHMHHKYALFDGRQLLTGSYNWTRSASQYNAENFIVTTDAGLLGEFRRDFERLWGSLA